MLNEFEMDLFVVKLVRAVLGNLFEQALARRGEAAIKAYEPAEYLEQLTLPQEVVFRSRRGHAKNKGVF